MLRNRKESTPRQSRGKNDLAQTGLFGVPDFSSDLGGLDDGDDDPELEAELMSILSAGGPPKQISAPKKAKNMPHTNLDQMIAESLRDIPSDDSSGEDDPSLLAELQAYTSEKAVEVALPTAPSASQVPGIISLLSERLEMYKEAEENAKSSGDTAKARRLRRGLQTLEDLMKKARNGLVIDESEIPLPVTIKKKDSAPPPTLLPETSAEEEPKPPPVPPRRSVPAVIEPVNLEEPASPVDQGVLAALQARRDEYKRAAVIAKKAGDLETAKAHVRVIKQFESVIASAEGGQKVNLNTMPPSPFTPASPPAKSVQVPVPSPLPSPVTPSLPETSEPAENSVPPEPQQDNNIPQPANVLEALEQRLAVFKKQEETAKSDGNASKARRMGRIAKQYEDAIKMHRAGKDIPVDDLPTPPGFPPIPVEKKLPVSPSVKPELLTPENQPRPAPTRQSLPPSPTPSTSSATSTASAKISGRATRQDKQMAILQKRQKEWKEAAIAAKKAGDISKAKDCLRQAKGFDPLIEATQNGLPVDLNTIPVPPKDKMENDFEVINIKDCIAGSNFEIYEQLKADLKRQFQMSMDTRLHYKSLGDVGNANKFEQLAVHTKKDLDRVMLLHERDDPVPRYHYEMRTFSILRSASHIFGRQNSLRSKSNTDLNDNDLELSIIQGVSYNVPNPKEIDTYVRYEFPYPSEEPKKDKTPTVYNTNNPQYNYVTLIPILRNNRACQRVFRRQSLKLEVWSKGGFLRSDTLVGTVNVKLQPLETKCIVHDSFNLMDGRKPVGGKLEVKIRIRQPIQENEIEQVKEKWLLID